VCEHVTYFEGTPPSFIARRVEEQKAAGQSRVAAASPAGTPKGKKGKKTPNSERRRPPPAKKKKTLKSMLAQSQNAAKANAAPSALSLYSFLEAIK
jgi:hypothetical protein